MHGRPSHDLPSRFPQVKFLDVFFSNSDVTVYFFHLSGELIRGRIHKGMESNSANNDARKMIDTLVAGYLGRQKYWESLKCLMNESSILHAAQCGGMSIILGDTVHGKHLEEIIILFSEYGSFGLNPGLLDFGVRLRSLANEFTSLTNAGAHWSDAQKLLYGRHSAPSRNCSQQCLPVSAGELNVCGTNQNMLPPLNADSTTSVSSQHSSGSASTRRKCTQPVSINTRRREFMKEVVQPVVHTAQQIIDNGSGNITDPNSSLSALSMITIDESAVGTLDRCMAHENFAELIESIEKDFPDGFFDSFPNSDNTESLHEGVFEAVSSHSNEVQQERESRVDDSQNLYNIPHSEVVEESKPLCSSTPTKLKTQEKSSAMLSVPGISNSKASSSLKAEPRRLQQKILRKKQVVAESAIFKDRVEVECPYLPVEENEKEEADDTDSAGLFLTSKNFMKSDDDSFSKTKTSKLEISAGWRKLAELCDESRKTAEVEERKGGQNSDSPETHHSTNQKQKDKGAKFLSPFSVDLELKKKIRNELCTSSSASCNADVASHSAEKCIKGMVENTKFSSKSSIEREIELLFEDSEDQSYGNWRMQRGDERKSTDTTRAAQPRENRKESEDREEETKISGDENPITVCCERQASVKLTTDRKKKRHQKQKPIGGDFVGDSKISVKKRQLEEAYISSPVGDTDRQGDGSPTGSSSLCKPSEQCKKQDKFKKFEEDRDEARISAEKRKKEKEFLMKKEREEIERQKRELEEKELKRATERERKRREEEEREAREKEQREKRRKEREDREKLKKMKEKEDKLVSNSDLRRQRERSKDGKSKRELKNSLQFDSKSDESNEASILDRLFGDGDNLRPMTKIPEREETKKKVEENRTRSSFIQKCTGKMKIPKEECRAKREKPERGSDIKTAKSTMDSGLNRPDALDDLFNCLVAKPGTSRKDETDAAESKSCKKVVSGVNKGRENLLVGGGHSARVGMVLEKATRIRTKYEHEEKLKQEYRKVEGIRRVGTSSSEYSTRKRILDLPIPKTPDILSQLLKQPDASHSDSLRRSISAKNISNCTEANLLAPGSSKIPPSSKSTTCPSFSGSCSESKSLHYNESSSVGSSNIQVKKPRLDMAAIDAVLQTLHGLDKASSSTSLSTASASGSEQTLT
uniref:LisH domain-containing protein n=1 Tax=Setaria digitata TaxID=48799 RepID=A0A915PQH7_9BILA